MNRQLSLHHCSLNLRKDIKFLNRAGQRQARLNVRRHIKKTFLQSSWPFQLTHANRTWKTDWINKPSFLNYQDLKKAHNNNDNDNNNNSLTFNGVVQAFLHWNTIRLQPSHFDFACKFDHNVFRQRYLLSLLIRNWTT